jgi:hypothetical protein
LWGASKDQGWKLSKAPAVPVWPLPGLDFGQERAFRALDLIQPGQRSGRPRVHWFSKTIKKVSKTLGFAD